MIASTEINHNKVRRMEKGETSIMQMEPNSTAYHKVTITKNFWMCADCGLVWAMRHDAQTCASRDHKPSYVKRYGGYMENGVWKGGQEYTISSIRQEKVSKEAAEQ